MVSSDTQDGIALLKKNGRKVYKNAGRNCPLPAEEDLYELTKIKISELHAPHHIRAVHHLTNTTIAERRKSVENFSKSLRLYFELNVLQSKTTDRSNQT
mmetsp:Transcript_44620/g.83802  ORF Transcript_44620/g.83802 Transcript_44620/m.83802 type:complete len:99 (-) Transcript_44620:92-388(-)